MSIKNKKAFTELFHFRSGQSEGSNAVDEIIESPARVKTMISDGINDFNSIFIALRQINFFLISCNLKKENK